LHALHTVSVAAEHWLLTYCPAEQDEHLMQDPFFKKKPALHTVGLHSLSSVYVEPEHFWSKYWPIGQLVLHLVQPNWSAVDVPVQYLLM
jgi:hypothetical protein